jgi:hypothetical protein
MKNKLRIIKAILTQIINDIDTGNSNISEDQYDDILEQISFYTDAKSKMSKYQAAKYLNISRATFDNYVKLGSFHKDENNKGLKNSFDIVKI